jgi:hypothetical protein
LIIEKKRRGSKKEEEGVRMVNAQVSRRGWKVRKVELDEGRKGMKQEEEEMKEVGDMEDVGR